MTVDTIIEQAGIPLLLLVICVYYAIRLIVLHDSQAIRGKNKPPVKDEELDMDAAYEEEMQPVEQPNDWLKAVEEALSAAQEKE